MHPRPRLLIILVLFGLLLAPAVSAALPARLGPAPAALADPPRKTPTPAPSRTYVVQEGDTLGDIALHFDITTEALISANNLANPDSLTVGQRLRIPGVAPVPGESEVATEPAAGPATETAVEPAAEPTEEKRGSILQRLPQRARKAEADSPLRGTTWLTYYGRPNVPIMGILGEYGIDDLVPRLREQGRVYDKVNGPDLSVTDAFHLIYGMATAYEDDDGDYLTFLEDDMVREYIDRAAWEGMGVVLDVQIGAATPLDAIRPAFKFLKYRNVHLALDPEFAMTTPGQSVPGQPPGLITAERINEVQSAIVQYMQEQGISGHKILIVHQFLLTMIVDKEAIQEVPSIDVVITADGFGEPPTKIAKYNSFMTETVQYGGFKLFYQWDEPLMSEAQALGEEPFAGMQYMDATPSLIIYQ